MFRDTARRECCLRVDASRAKSPFEDAAVVARYDTEALIRVGLSSATDQRCVYWLEPATPRYYEDYDIIEYMYRDVPIPSYT